jgi:hypothetical protein
MHMGGHGMKCPMASMPSHQATTCTCSVSPHETSAFAAGPLDLRYDLPRASHSADLPCSARKHWESQVSFLDGFFPLPEQVPKALLA